MKNFYLTISIISGLAAIYAFASFFIMVDIGKMEGESGFDSFVSAGFGALVLAMLPTFLSFYFFKKFKKDVSS